MEGTRELGNLEKQAERIEQRMKLGGRRELCSVFEDLESRDQVAEI